MDLFADRVMCWMRRSSAILRARVSRSSRFGSWSDCTQSKKGRNDVWP
jgi:hypothetical protein